MPGMRHFDRPHEGRRPGDQLLPSVRALLTERSVSGTLDSEDPLSGVHVPVATQKIAASYRVPLLRAESQARGQGVPRAVHLGCNRPDQPVTGRPGRRRAQPREPRCSRDESVSGPNPQVTPWAHHPLTGCRGACQTEDPSLCFPIACCVRPTTRLTFVAGRRLTVTPYHTSTQPAQAQT